MDNRSHLSFPAFCLGVLILHATTGCSDPPKPLYLDPFKFDVEQEELIEEVTSTNPSVEFMPMPSQVPNDEGTRAPIARLEISDKTVAIEELRESLIQFNRLRPIQVVQIASENVVDEDLEFLGSLDDVVHLSVEGSRVSDTGISHISGLVSLHELRLNGCQATDDGLAHLSRLANLRNLWLIGSQVSGPGAAHLQNLSSLTLLIMTGSPITDEGLEYFSKIESLQLLNLSHTQITDKGLMKLQRLKNLKTVNVEFTGVTKGGVAAFKKDRPKVQIIHGP